MEEGTGYAKEVENSGGEGGGRAQENQTLGM